MDLGSPPTRGEHLEGSVSSFSNGWQRLCTAQVSTGAYKEPALLVWMRVESLKRAERNVLRFKIKKLLLLYVAFIIQIGSQLFRDNTDKKSRSAGYIESSVPCWWQHAMSLFSYERYMPMGAAKPWAPECAWMLQLGGMLWQDVLRDTAETWRLHLQSRDERFMIRPWFWCSCWVCEACCELRVIAEPPLSHDKEQQSCQFSSLPLFSIQFVWRSWGLMFSALVRGNLWTCRVPPCNSTIPCELFWF